MNEVEIREALRDIGLALHACHNTVATDIPLPDEDGWRIDNGREIEQLRALERALLPDREADPDAEQRAPRPLRSPGSGSVSGIP